MLRAEIRVQVDLERELPGLGLVPEWARNHVDEIGERDVFGIHRHGARLDLGEIENVADQVQQISSGAVDGTGELDLLRRKVAVRVIGELLAQNQDAVERRAQLVRHVGEEFGFVFRGQRKLGGLFLQRAAGLLDFLVLALDLDVRSASCCAFCSSCSLVCCSSLCCACNSPASCCDCLSRPSVCMVASMLLSTMPMLVVSCSRNIICSA